MDQQGGTNAFSNLPYFAHLNLIERNLIVADWADIVWWATSMTKVAPKLGEALSAVTASANPESDMNVEEKRKALRAALGEVTKNAHTPCADGWGLALMYVLADSRPSVATAI